MGTRAKITYPSGRTFTYIDFGEHAEYSIEVEENFLSEQTFVLKTFPKDHWKPQRGTSGLRIEIDKESMDRIVATYKKKS